MRKYEKRQLPAATRQVLTEIKCDLCGNTTKDLWKNASRNVCEVDVRLKTGVQYREGGGGEETTIDICPECFVQRLIPWVISQGGEPTTKEWDW